MVFYPSNNSYHQPGYYGQPVPEQYSRQNQVMQQPVMQTQNQPQQLADTSGMIWVQGEAGARSYWVAPGQSVILVDSEQWALGKYVFYIKSMDNSGMPLPLKILDAAERNSTQSTSAAAQNVSNVDMSNYITREEFEEKIASLTTNKKTSSRNKEETSNG